MVYVVGVTVVPGQMLRRTLVRELAALLGVGLVMVAVGLSDGFASPYLLLSVGPSLLAAATAGTPARDLDGFPFRPLARCRWPAHRCDERRAGLS